MAPSSSGLGHLVLIQKIAGSIPAGVTLQKFSEIFGSVARAPAHAQSDAKGFKLYSFKKKKNRQHKKVTLNILCAPLFESDVDEDDLIAAKEW